jgi:arylamine N-acetyltransferase
MEKMGRRLAMSDNPLAVPESAELLELFRSGCRLTSESEPVVALRQVATAFSRLPYENLTKIIKQHARGAGESPRRPPSEVLTDHFQYGAGGTCFSLTATLLHLVRCLGWRVEPILADRRYGANTHCALLVWIDDRPHLLDPGYLIVTPLPIGGKDERRIHTEFNQLLLTPKAGGERLDLRTVDHTGERYRLTFKTSPVDASEFLQAWDDSFSWDMMQYPLLTCTRGGRQLYLRGTTLQERDLNSVNRSNVARDEIINQINLAFGVAPSISRRALELLSRGRHDSWVNRNA